MRRFADKPDANRKAIVDFWQAHGATWLDVQSPKKGAPDGILGYRGVSELVELKTAKGRLSDAQATLHAWWRGRPVRVVRTLADAASVLSDMRAVALCATDGPVKAAAQG